MLNISPGEKINCGGVRFGAPSRWFWAGSRHIPGPAREGGQAALISNVFIFFQSENTVKFWKFPKESRYWLSHVITRVYVGQHQPAQEIPRAPDGPGVGPRGRKRRQTHRALGSPLHPSPAAACFIFILSSTMDFSWKKLSGKRSLKACIFSHIPTVQMKKMRFTEEKWLTLGQSVTLTGPQTWNDNDISYSILCYLWQTQQRSHQIFLFSHEHIIR